VSFEAISLAPKTLFSAIASACRFVCSACESRRIAVSPEWHPRVGARRSDQRLCLDQQRRHPRFPIVTQSSRRVPVPSGLTYDFEQIVR
jgi:hypothetical protein